MSLLFNMMSRFVILFLSRRTHLLILWLESPSTVIVEPKKTKSVTVSTFCPSLYHEVMGPDAMILVFRMLVLSQLFHCPLSPLARGSLVPLPGGLAVPQAGLGWEPQTAGPPRSTLTCARRLHLSIKGQVQRRTRGAGQQGAWEPPTGLRRWVTAAPLQGQSP